LGYDVECLKDGGRGDKMNNKGDSYYRTLLDAMPLMIFVVDDDVVVRDMNQAAAAVFGQDSATVINRRGGEVLQCLHAHDVPEGCGRGPFCKTCVIRNSVTKSSTGQVVTRKRTNVELLLGGSKKELALLITASPIPNSDEPLSLLIVEDVSEITILKDLIPICVKCKKVRDDREYWHSVESYFSDQIGVDFSHGICPECKTELYPDSAGIKKEK
jgi:PAS domain-containing protein